MGGLIWHLLTNWTTGGPVPGHICTNHSWGSLPCALGWPICTPHPSHPKFWASHHLRMQIEREEYSSLYNIFRCFCVNMPCFFLFPQFYRLTSLSICSILFHTQSIQCIFICLRVSNKSVWLEQLNLQEFLRDSLIISADTGKKINSGRLKTTENTFPAENEGKGVQTAEI